MWLLSNGRHRRGRWKNDVQEQLTQTKDTLIETSSKHENLNIELTSKITLKNFYIRGNIQIQFV